MYLQRRRSDGLGLKGIVIRASLSRVFFRVHFFVLFYQVFSLFCLWLCAFFKNRLLCFGFLFRYFCVLRGFNKF